MLVAGRSSKKRLVSAVNTAGITSSYIQHRHVSGKQRHVFDSSKNVLRSPFTDVVLSDLNLSDYVWRNTDKWSHWPALTDAVTGRSYSYGEARATSERLSISLPDSAGLKPGDALGIVMPNSPEFALTFLGASAAGIIVTPANPVYTAEELSRQFTDADVRAVVTVPMSLDKVRKALELVPGGGGQIVVATDGSGEQEATLASQHPDMLSLHKLLTREYTRRSPRLPRPDPDQIGILPYSSGTTGLPKGVLISHRNMVANLCQMEHPDVILHAPEGTQDVSLSILPFFHIYGMNGVMNVGLSLGRHTVTLPRFEAGEFATVLRRYKPTVLSVVPPLLMYLGGSEKISPADLCRVRFVTCGAAPASPALIQQFVKRLNNNKLDFREGYGMTETSCLATFTPRWTGLNNKVGSCGAPVPLTEVKIVDDQGQALPQGEQGEMLVRGPQVMQGYHNNEQATRETMTEDGWLKTGDMAYIDEDGYIFLVDRVKELIKVKGLQVSPTELEGILRTLDGVADVAVIGVPDERSGEVPRAFVVRAPNSDISEKDVIIFVEEKVAPFKRLIGGVRFVPEIPKNAAGKILRKIIKQIYNS